jgi:general secretion pathway protein L
LRLVLLIPDQSSFTNETRVQRGALFTNNTTGREIAAATLAGLRAAINGEPDVIALVPASRIVFIETPLPRVASAKREPLVRYAIEDKLTIDPATVHAVVLGECERVSTATANAPVNHIVVAVDRTWFAAALKWLRDAGLNPKFVFAETVLLPVAAREWSVLIEPATPYARRSDGYAYALDAANLDAPPFSLTLALSELTEKPTALALYPSDQATERALTDDVINGWQMALSMRVRREKPFDFLSSANRLSSKSGDLLTGEFAPTRASDAWIARLKPALILGSIMLCCQLAFTAFDFWKLDKQRQNIEAEMRATFQSAFPQATAIVDPALQMERNLATLRRERGINSVDEHARALAQFAAITKAVPDFAIGEVRIADKTATLFGKLASEKQLTTLQREVARISTARLSTPKVDNQIEIVLALDAQ